MPWSPLEQIWKQSPKEVTCKPTNEPEDVSFPQFMIYSTPQLSMTWSRLFAGQAAAEAATVALPAGALAVVDAMECV